MSNYASRQSNKSLSTNKNNEIIFGSMSQILESDVFEKAAHQTMNGN